MDWIKLMCNILDHRKVKMIQNGPEGNTLVLLWILILAEAGKCNRGGYLMVTDGLPYTVETLSMITGISLPTVKLGMLTYDRLEMVDEKDGAIYIKNWSKYQSADKLTARRESDRERKRRQRERDRENILRLPPPECLSRDSHALMSRDVTPQNRTDEKVNIDTTTIDEIKVMMSGTPLYELPSQALLSLAETYGYERLLLVADVAAETWRRDPKVISNPGGYLRALAKDLVIPPWYRPHEDRKAAERAAQQRRSESERDAAMAEMIAEAESAAMEELWLSLDDTQRKEYHDAARATLPRGIGSDVATVAIAKTMAWGHRAGMFTNADTSTLRAP